MPERREIGRASCREAARCDGDVAVGARGVYLRGQRSDVRYPPLTARDAAAVDVGAVGARQVLDAQEIPLALAATLVFEQSYETVEGDSASLAELLALLSALADAPLRQDLAVTGSINQWGEVQAVGGVNEKIEGFFDLCQARGLTGEQGVLIPVSNVKHLMLRADLVEAVKAGAFHIHAIENVDQAGGCSYNYSCVYTDTISWASPRHPLPMIRDPRAVFDQLFGVGATTGERQARRRDDQSILDWVTEAVQDLSRQLGTADRARLSEYLESVREIERRARCHLHRDKKPARAIDGQRHSVSSGDFARKVSRGRDEGPEQLRLPASHQARREHAGA